jgi:hypothetical protein
MRLPEPEPEPIPNAKDDPFGAMNALAAKAVTAAQPEYVIVNDGKPVESVEKRARGILIAKYAGLVAGSLLVGVAVGQMGTKASIYNETIDDASAIAATVKSIDRDLQNLRNVLYTAKERGEGGQGYAMADEQLAKELEGLGLTVPDLTPVYESNLYNMEQGVVDQTIAFLTEAGLLYKQIKEHINKTANDAKALALKRGRLEQVGVPTQYGVVVEIPKGKDAAGEPVTATFVELGNPLCDDGKPSAAGCSGPPKGFLYRPSELGPWGQKNLAMAEGESIPGGRLIPLGFSPSPRFTALFSGGGPTVAEENYRQRIEEIDAKVDDLMERAKKIQAALTATASRSKEFSFFL